MSQDSYTKSNPLKNARLHSESDSKQSEDEVQGRVTLNKKQESDQLDKKVNNAKEIQVRDSELSLDSDRSSIASSVSKLSIASDRLSIASSISSRPRSDSNRLPLQLASKSRNIVLKDLDWLYRHCDMSGEKGKLPRVTEIYLYGLQ